jgi:hypothetical protein
VSANGLQRLSKIVTEGYKELALGQTTLSLLLKTSLQFLHLHDQGMVFFG